MLKKKTLYILILLVLGFATRFIYFGYPSQVVFDETYFGTYASNYLTGNYFFDPHPPLGKLIIAFGGSFSPEPPVATMFEHIGQEFSNNSYIFLRFLPMVAGAILPLVIFLLCLELGFSEEASLFSGLLVVFDTALLIESRFILLDSFILLFGFFGLYLYFFYRRTKSIWALIIAILALSATLCIKWTGLTFLGLAGLLEIVSLIKEKASIKKWLSRGVLFLIVPALIYLGIFALHFAILSKPGTGDAFMSPQFHTESFFAKFIEAQHEMYAVQSQVNLQTHPYSSKWYTWPFMLRGVYYWLDSKTQSKIYLLGNPIMYWSATLSVILSTLLFIAMLIKKSWRKSLVFTPTFLLLGYFVNWLPFSLIHRAMFLYHYLPAFVFSCLIMAYLIDQIKNVKYRNTLFILVGIACITMFIFFWPIVYGLPLSDAAFNSRMWLHSWI